MVMAVAIMAEATAAVVMAVAIIAEATAAVVMAVVIMAEATAAVVALNLIALIQVGLLEQKVGKIEAMELLLRMPNMKLVGVEEKEVFPMRASPQTSQTSDPFPESWMSF